MGTKLKEKRKALKAKKKLILNSIENPVPSTSSANNEGTNCPGCEHTCDEDWIQYCKEWWHEKCPSYEGSLQASLYATTAKFSGCVLLDSCPEYSYPPRRVRVLIWHFFPYVS
ncbi:hypothetical protein AVEN_56403-1 [Araneus ventricosus]|uniref:Uncharacterized protein n=1 Tax=Araneus ventricosus TaxID=182803 RepID=A0A4Y2GNN5_ARAVE|nr:hypothetical protein AVEN_56403-1 [Araneus ventricosus]